MPVKVGSSYVSEAALAYAQNQVAEETETNGNLKSQNQIANSKAGEVFKSLSKQFPNVNFSVGTQPFSGSGLNNISISPNILRQMANDPEKRLEYEALIYDCNQTLKDTGNLPGRKTQGFIIGSDGGLRMWSISGGDDGKQKRSLLNVDKDKLAGRLPKKKSSRKNKLSEQRSKNSTPEKFSALTKNLTLENSKDESTKKSSDEESEENQKIGGKVAFNESKRSRQLAAAQTIADVRQIMELLKNDLEDCENGLKNGWCDEAEVEKVKKMIERAQKRLYEVSDVDDGEINDGASTQKFSVDILI